MAHRVVVELSYDMSKAYGERRIELADVATVRDAVAQVGVLFHERGAELEALSRTTAIAVNGVLAKHRSGMGTALSDGDRVAFVKAASGG